MRKQLGRSFFMIVIIQKLTVHVPMIHNFNYMFCTSQKYFNCWRTNISALLVSKVYVALLSKGFFFLMVICMFSATFINIQRADTTRFLWILAFMYSRKTGFPFCSWIYWDSSWREAIIHGVPSSNTHTVVIPVTTV